MAQATIASPIGTARMPTQGSWRPLVMMSINAVKGVEIGNGFEAARITGE